MSLLPGEIHLYPTYPTYATYPISVVFILHIPLILPTLVSYLSYFYRIDRTYRANRGYRAYRPVHLPFGAKSVAIPATMVSVESITLIGLVCHTISKKHLK